MLTIISGNQRSGKSIYYEKILEEKKNILYFATLEAKEQNMEIIERHRSRRNAKWIVVESKGDVDLDKLTLIETIEKANKPLYIMIDGLTNWCMYCLSKDRQIVETATRIGNLLVELSAIYYDAYWYLLDNKKIDYVTLPTREIACEQINRILLQRMKNAVYIDWRPMT